MSLNQIACRSSRPDNPPLDEAGLSGLGIFHLSHFDSFILVVERVCLHLYCFLHIPATCVYSSLLLSLYSIITGGSSGAPRRSVRRRKHNFHLNDEGVYVDDHVTLQRAKEELREAAEEKKKRAAMRRKGKTARLNYKTMDSIEYAALRQKDWYEDVPRDEDIEDTNFWCMEQLFIYKDIYDPMKKPVRPMHPIDIDYLRTKTYFAEAVEVTEKMGLHHLMRTQCNYNVMLVQQFFSTLVFKNDDAHTLRWMTGSSPCESKIFSVC